MKQISLIFIPLLFTLHAYGETPTNETPSFIKRFTIGAATGATATLALEPVIYIKNSWQQRKALSSNPRVWYRGLFVNGAGSVPTLAVQNSVYGHTEQYLQKRAWSPTQTKAIASIVTGIACAVPTTPRELLIIQQQNNGGLFYAVTRNIIQQHGIQGLFRAFVPVALRNSNASAFFFVACPAIETYIKRHTSNPGLVQLAPGMLAGALSAAITHPLDTIKTNMQAQLHEPNARTIVKQIYHATEQPSIMNFYKGATPRLFGVGLSMLLVHHLRAFYSRTL